MTPSLFVESEFILLLISVIIVPIALYGIMMWKKSISRITVLLFAVTLIVIAGGNVFLLQLLRKMASATPSLLDDRIFSSEISVALYLIPAIFAGIGINLISHIVISHLTEAERRFDREQGRQ